MYDFVIGIHFPGPYVPFILISQNSRLGGGTILDEQKERNTLYEVILVSHEES